MSNRILIIDDEPQIRKFLDISLRSQGFATSLAPDGLTGLSQLAGGGVDLVVLDLGLPDMDGLDVLRELRAWSAVPVLILTVRADERQKVALLDAGANDYVTKPFGVDELLARIRVLLRAAQALTASSGAPTVEFDDGELHVNLVERRVLFRGEALTLTRKEFQLLALLVRHPGRVLTQPMLLRELWGPTHEADTHYLRILVSKLRFKLCDDPAQPRYILTDPGVGLRFIGGG